MDTENYSSELAAPETQVTPSEYAIVTAGSNSDQRIRKRADVNEANYHHTITI